MSASGGTLTFPNLSAYQQALTYNDADQVTTVQTSSTPSGVGYTTTRVYDPTTGVLTGLSNNSITTPNVATISYTAQALPGTLTFLANSTTTIASESLSYDGDLRPSGTTATWQNGSGSSGNFFVQNLSYDPAGNVTSLSTQQAAVPGTNNSGGSETQNFCYDEQNRLVWAGNSGTQPGAGNGTCGSGTLSSGLSGASYSTSYVYTHLGQLWQGPYNGTGSYQYLYCNSSQPHQLSWLYPTGTTCATTGGKTQTYGAQYDSWGNLTTRTATGSGSTTATLAYDGQDHLVRWNDTVTSANEEWYMYDGAGQRVLRRSQTGTGTSNTKYTVYAFGVQDDVYDGSGASYSDKYYYSLAGHLIGDLNGGKTKFLLTDLLGSVIASISNTANSAAVLGNQVYGPYGNGSYSKGTITTPKGYTGQYNDSLTQLDYFNARYYDPVVGVFLSADTANGNMAGMNPYAYVNGNPETYSDPTGRYMGTAIPLSQVGGAIGYAIPGTDVITTVKNTNYIGSITTLNGKQTTSWSNFVANTFTRGGEILYGGYNSDTDAQNSPLAKLSQAIGLPQLQQVWSDPHATWLDKLMAIGNFAGTNLNNLQQLAMILGGPEGDAEAAAAEEESALAAGLKECGALSFTPATPVATAKGEQAIGTMKVGEKVWAYNPKTHKMELEPVLHVWINHDTDLVDLTLTTTKPAQHGKAATKMSETIHTNKKHPFLTKEKGFLPVGQISVGMHVLRADGMYGVVTGWKVVPGSEVMYNLEVAQDHTFTVGAEQWVVHNSDCGGFLNDARRTQHFMGHNSEFDPPFVSPEQYENAGKLFMSGERPEGVMQGRLVGGYFNGDIIRYNTITNEFGMMSSNGVLRTFYKPVNGIQEFWDTLMPNGVLDMSP